jgi:uncharacterized protein YjbJ (UPF0337 family)
MNWDHIAGRWKQLKGGARRRWGRMAEDDARLAREKQQLAEWLARRHKIDPIHK